MSSVCLQVLPIIHPLRQVGSCCCTFLWVPDASQALFCCVVHLSYTLVWHLLCAASVLCDMYAIAR